MQIERMMKRGTTQFESKNAILMSLKVTVVSPNLPLAVGNLWPVTEETYYRLYSDIIRFICINTWLFLNSSGLKTQSKQLATVFYVSNIYLFLYYLRPWQFPREWRRGDEYKMAKLHYTILRHLCFISEPVKNPSFSPGSTWNVS